MDHRYSTVGEFHFGGGAPPPKKAEEQEVRFELDSKPARAQVDLQLVYRVLSRFIDSNLHAHP